MRILCGLLLIVATLSFAGDRCVAQAAPAAAPDMSQLAQAAADPTSPILVFNMKGEYVPSTYSHLGSSSDFILQPIIPFVAFGHDHLFRTTITYDTSGPPFDTTESDYETGTSSGLASISIFDMFVFNKSWGRFGFGPLVSFTANQGRGVDTATAGPVIGFVAKKGRWNLGLLNQDLFGQTTRFSNIQPIIAYSLGRGYALDAGSAQWAIDWREPEFKNLPLGVQFSKVQYIKRQRVRFAFNPEYNARSIPKTSQWTMRFVFTIFSPER